MTKLFSERLIKDKESETVIPEGSFRLRFLKQDVLFKSQFKVILTENRQAKIPMNTLNSVEGLFTVEKSKPSIIGSFKKDKRKTPKSEIKATVGYFATPAENEDYSLKATLFKNSAELENANMGKILLGEGSVGPYVVKIQRALNLLLKEADGYIPLKEEKDFGPLTKAAVIKFQNLNSLKADGIIGKKTIRKLDSVLTEKDSNTIVKGSDLDEVTVTAAYTGDKKITKENLEVDPRLNSYTAKAQANAIIYSMQSLYRSKENPDPRFLTEKQKQDEFKKSSENTTAILLGEYLTGTGPRDRSFDETFPFTKDIMRGLTTARAYHNFLLT